MKLTNLITQLNGLDASLKKHVSHSANVGLTIRNWLVGAYLVEYEQNGEDRAEYGEKLIEQVAKKISIKGLNKGRIWLCRQFYETYPQILTTLSGEFNNLLPDNELQILLTVSGEFKKDPDLPLIPAEKLINGLSFSHFAELVKNRVSNFDAYNHLILLRGIFVFAYSGEQMGFKDCPDPPLLSA